MKIALATELLMILAFMISFPVENHFIFHPGGQHEAGMKTMEAEKEKYTK